MTSVSSPWPGMVLFVSTVKTFRAADDVIRQIPSGTQVELRNELKNDRGQVGEIGAKGIISGGVTKVSTNDRHINRASRELI